MRERGIDLHYTDRLEVLAPETLSSFDAIIVYANHVSISSTQEDALFQFVEEGGGFVPVHCASYCFLDSPAYVELVGAQFRSHGTGTFQTTRVAPEHPAITGLPPLESWDETYVHHRHSEDRTVLATRDEEPWTWVREHGDGRVFYTAWGHDLRTWTNPAFHELLARGIRWSAGDEALALPVEPPPFVHVEAADRIPNYEPGRHGEPMRTMPRPLPAESSRTRMSVAPGLQVELFAAEPEITKPIAMAWDERGRLWILETTDYPNDRVEEGPGNDRIRILEDTDGDGRADSFKTFADGLSIPTSLTFANGGVIVAQAPQMLFFRDEDGDDVADERRVLFEGWGVGDTHAGPSSLRVGFDGWVWGCVGYAGFNGVVGGEQQRFGQGLYRFRPDGTELEFLGANTNNAWGLGFSEEGFVFGSTANGNPSVNLAIPARYYESIEGWSPGAMQTIAESLQFHPITEAVRQVDWHGKFTAAAGHALYTARAFPPAYWNTTALVNAPTGHLIHRFRLERDGTAFVARDDWNLLASDDEWTAPIFSEVGPDGSVWFIDWYSYIVQHNPTPPGFDNGPGNAYVTPLRDKVHGRIYRIKPDDAGRMDPVIDLSRLDSSALVEVLGSPNLGVRLTAQRLLVERDAREVTAALIAGLASSELDAVGLAPGALHALWTLSGIGAFADAEPEVDDALVGALRHPASAVRRAAVEVLPRESWALEVLLSGRLLEDNDPHVRLATLLTLSEMPASEAAGRAVFAMMERAENEQDRWIPDAATCAAAQHDAGFMKALIASERVVDADVASEVRQDLISNGGFEQGDGATSPESWGVRHYSGQAQHRHVHTGRTGRALRIDSEDGADSSWFTTVRVDRDTTYELSGWIRTEGLQKHTGLGALLNVHEIQGSVNARTPAVESEQWQRVHVAFDTGGREEISINCLFGGWGQSKGTAFFDDVRLERLRAPLLEGPLGKIATRVASNYARRGPTESIVSTISALGNVAPGVAELFLGGLADGWPDGEPPTLSEGDEAVLGTTMQQLHEAGRAQLARLVDRWGRRDVLAGSVERVIRSLHSSLQDEAGQPSTRIAAGERLVALADGAETVRAIIGQLAVTSEPELATGLLASLASSRWVDVGTEVLARWDVLSPSAQRTAATLLTRRVEWTTALLAAIEAGALPPSLVDPDQWTRLDQHPDEEVRALAARARDSGGDGDGAALVERYAEAGLLRGDAERGHALFSEHCAKCHVFSNEGTRVGPDLGGIGARPAGELLVAILDPNRSVEANYQLWTVETTDGLVYGGLLVAETRTTVELLESSGERRVIAREELDSITPSSVSLMPAGFESMGAESLADLLAYLRTSH